MCQSNLQFHIYVEANNSQYIHVHTGVFTSDKNLLYVYVNITIDTNWMIGEIIYWCVIVSMCMNTSLIIDVCFCLDLLLDIFIQSNYALDIDISVYYKNAYFLVESQWGEINMSCIKLIVVDRHMLNFFVKQ